jgi:hypothetical protein
MFALDALIGEQARRHALAIVYAIVLALTAVATFPAGWCRRTGIVLAGITLVGHWAVFFVTGVPFTLANMADYFGGALFLFYAFGMILLNILVQQEITIDTICGAVCGYLLLGLGCAWLYALMETLAPGSFNGRPEFAAWFADDHLRRSILAYYSFVTLSTAGYGDITPLSQAARTLSWAEAVAGQFYMAILVAGLVGISISRIASQRDAVAASRATGENSHAARTQGPNDK